MGGASVVAIEFRWPSGTLKLNTKNRDSRSIKLPKRCIKKHQILANTCRYDEPHACLFGKNRWPYLLACLVICQTSKQVFNSYLFDAESAVAGCNLRPLSVLNALPLCCIACAILHFEHGLHEKISFVARANCSRKVLSRNAINSACGLHRNTLAELPRSA
jgi:hypothetical protein